MGAFHILLVRELKALFVSPVLWVVMVMFLLFNGVWFWQLLNLLSQPMGPEGSPMQFFFGGTLLFWLVFLIVCTVIPMGSIASERRNGTIETLMTAPVTDAAVILAKFVAAWAFYGLLWVPTLSYVLLLYQYSEGTLDMGPIGSAYLGTMLLGGAFLSIGIFASTMTRNQIVAAMVTFGVCGLLFLIWVLGYIPSSSDMQEDLVGYLSIFNHMEHWAQGLVDTRHIVYCLSIMAFNLFCAVRLLETRRWR